VPNAERIDIVEDWSEEGGATRVYKLQVEPTGDWWGWFKEHARGRLSEVRPPFGVELATGANTVQVSGVTDEDVANVDDLVQSLVAVTNERMVREALRR